MKVLRLVQLVHPKIGRRVAMVDEPRLVLLDAKYKSVYTLVWIALQDNRPINEAVYLAASGDRLNYNDVYQGSTDWRFLPPLDHPDNPYACLVSGTGLTHRSSALNRQAMHIDMQKQVTDSMIMFQWGLEGGKPAVGKIGVQPEWFYKGNGLILRAHGETLCVPTYADDGGEEAEIACLYIIDQHGTPIRIGFSNGNEFSDHVMEKKNYLYLAPSKLRECAIGPELVIGADFTYIAGHVKIKRKGCEIWQQRIQSGEDYMAHSLANLEHHHFKYEFHRMPGQVHVHFLGADAFSFGQQILLESGDSCEISWNNLGRPLCNTIHHQTRSDTPVEAKPILI